MDVVGEAVHSTGGGKGTLLVLHGRNRRLDPYRGVRVREAALPGPPKQLSRPPDHYSALRVLHGATPEQMKKAYRKHSLTEHPDKGGSSERFQALERAYRVLSNPRLKAAYEREVAEWEARNRQGAGKGRGKGLSSSTAASSSSGAAAAASCLARSASRPRGVARLV